MKRVLNFFRKAKVSAVKMYDKAKENVLAIATATMAIMPASALSVYATEQQLMNGVLEMVFKIFRYIGILLLAWSIGMLVLAFKNEDADSKSRAMMMMVVSVVLIGIKTLFTSLNITI